MEPEELVAFVDLNTLLFEPGTSFSYTNTGYVILGLVVEAVTGEDVAAELRDRVLEPAGISSTFMAGYEPERVIPVPGYDYLDVDDVPDVVPFDYQAHATTLGVSGALVSNGPDLLDFTSALFDAEIISGETLGTMLNQPILPEFQHPAGQHVPYSLGIHQRLDSDIGWMHVGSTGPDFGSMFIHDPDTGTTVVALTNCAICQTSDGT